MRLVRSARSRRLFARVTNLALVSPDLRASIALLAVALLGFGAPGCGGRHQPDVAGQAAPMGAVPTASAAASADEQPSAPQGSSESTCWKITAAPDSDEAKVAQRFARYASETLAALETPRVGTHEASVSAELRRFGLNKVGEVCPELTVSLTRDIGENASSARFLVRGELDVTIDAKIPSLRSAALASVEAWELGEPLVDSLARQLLLLRVAKILDDSTAVKNGAVLKVDKDLLWGWARTEDHLSQCFFYADSSTRWCWRTGQPGSAFILSEWSRHKDEVRGFVQSKDGVIWATRFPAGEFAQVTSARQWPTTGFAPLPNDDPASEVMLLPVVHDRRSDSAYVVTDLGSIQCRKRPKGFLCTAT